MARIEMRLLSAQKEVLFVIAAQPDEAPSEVNSSTPRTNVHEIKESKVYLPSTSIFVPLD